MRINTYNQVSQLYQANKANKASKAYGNVQSQTAQDQLHISRTGRDYQIAKHAVAGASEIREDKVAQLKERVASGNYDVNMDDFAQKLVEKYSGLL